MEPQPGERAELTRLGPEVKRRKEAQARLLFLFLLAVRVLLSPGTFSVSFVLFFCVIFLCYFLLFSHREPRGALWGAEVKRRKAQA